MVYPVLPGASDPFGEGPHQAEQGRQRSPGDRLAYASAYESLTFPFVTRGGAEMTVFLTAQSVFDLVKSAPAARRIRRIVRHSGGQRALAGAGRRPLEPADLKRLDQLSLKYGLDILRLGADDCGVLPAYWRTVATSHGRFALLYAGLQHAEAPGLLLVEVMGGPEMALADNLAEVIAHFETERLGVIVHVAPDVGLARRLMGARIQCLAIDFAGVDHAGGRAWNEAVTLIGAARATAPKVMLLNLRPEWGEAAAMAGATHAVFAPMESVTV